MPNDIKDVIRDHIESQNKTKLYNLYHSKQLTLDELCEAIFEIDDSVTDLYKFKKWFITLWL